MKAPQRVLSPIRLLKQPSRPKVRKMKGNSSEPISGAFDEFLGRSQAVKSVFGLTLVLASQTLPFRVFLGARYSSGCTA